MPVHPPAFAGRSLLAGAMVSIILQGNAPDSGGTEEWLSRVKVAKRTERRRDEHPTVLRYTDGYNAGTFVQPTTCSTPSSQASPPSCSRLYCRRGRSGSSFRRLLVGSSLLLQLEGRVSVSEYGQCTKEQQQRTFFSASALSLK